MDLENKNIVVQGRLIGFESKIHENVIILLLCSQLIYLKAEADNVVLKKYIIFINKLVPT